MSAFFSLLGADLRFNRWRLALLIIITAAALFTYVALGAILAEMQVTATTVWRSESRFDIAVAAPTLDATKASAVAGVRLVEKALMTTGLLGASEVEFMSLGADQQLYALTLAGGRLPAAAGEVTLPAAAATALRVDVGDTIAVLPSAVGKPIALAVVGVFEGKLGTPLSPLLTVDGLRAFGKNSQELLLVVLDGTVDLEATVTTMKGLYPGASVVGQDHQYEGVKTGLGIAGTLISSIRNLVLLITAVAVGALVWLVQRQRSFEFGLLRAMGVSKALVVLPACLNVGLAFILSAPLAWAALLAARPLLRAPRLELLRSVWLSSAGTFTVLALIIVAGVSLSLASQRIPALLNDTWGRG